jgi:hypothetical protein
MRLTDITALARPIDPNYPTNRAIALLALVVMVVGAILQWVGGAPLLESAGWGVSAGLSVFLSWALARELDPDHDLSAFVAAALMLFGLLLFNLPDLLALFWLILALRTINRTEGLPARPLDSLAILGLGSWLVWQGNWIAGLMTLVVFVLDSVLSPRLRRHSILAGVALGTVAVLIAFHGDLVMGRRPYPLTVITVAAASVLFLALVLTSRHIQAVGDATGEPLSSRRVQAAQVLALATGLLATWWDGTAGVGAWLPLWAAMLGTGLYRLGLLVVPRSR